MSSLSILPPPGCVRLMGEIEFGSARLGWLERHAACLAGGQGIEFFDDLAFASERLWSAVQKECRSSATIKNIAGRLIKPEFAAHELADISAEAAAQMREAVSEDLLRLELEARGALEAGGLTASHAAIAAIVADCCEVHAICAGIMRQSYCSHRSERHASALIAMLLHPAVNSGELLPQEIRASAGALVPYVPQHTARDDMASVLTPIRVTAVRERMRREARPTPTRSLLMASRVSRYATLTFEAAAAEMLADSPHKTALDTPHVTAGRGWSRATRQHFDGLLKLLVKWFRDRPVASLEVQDWRDFFGMLDRLPKLHHKSKFDRDRSLEEICGEAARKVAEGKLRPDQIGIGDGAINRNISYIATLYGWLSWHIDLPEIIWAQFCKPRPTPPRDRAYLVEQVRALFGHPIFTGRTAPTGPRFPGRWCGITQPIGSSS